MRKSTIDIPSLVKAYERTPNLHKMAEEFHTSHIRVAGILRENGVAVQNAGRRIDVSDDVVKKIAEDYSVHGLKVEEIAKRHSVPRKKVGKILREMGISTSRWNGHEKKVAPEKVTKERTEGAPVKKCALCGWTTADVGNRANSYQTHLKRVHGYKREDFLRHAEEHPEDIPHISHELNRLKNKVQCKVCGKYLFIIDDRHLSKHGITKEEYLHKYYGSPIISEMYKSSLQENYLKMMENTEWERFSSSYEKEIQSFLSSHGIVFTTHDRSVLNGNREIDILCGDVGIEFNGCLQHTEWFGKKTRMYHLKKTEECNTKGIRLIQIFEDEMVYKREIVFSKLSHIFGLDESLSKVYGRYCSVCEIGDSEAEAFLEKNHIQGFAVSTLYYGAYFHGELVGVMSFKVSRREGESWELTRFASDTTKCCSGIGGKLFNCFLKEKTPSEVKSFADRRWTTNPDDNLYTRLGFRNDGFLPPSYTYYYLKDNKPVRFHKFGFRKRSLHRRYGFSMNLSEASMAQMAGYDRIWDCGLIRYVWCAH